MGRIHDGSAMKGLRLADRIAGWASNLSALAAAAALVLMMVHVFADVIGRYVFNSPIEGTLETVQIYYMVMVVVLPFAYVTRKDGQIIVALFTQKMAPRPLAALDAAVGMVTLAFLGLLTWMSGIEAVEKTVLGEVREFRRLRHHPVADKVVRADRRRNHGAGRRDPDHPRRAQGGGQMSRAGGA